METLEKRCYTFSHSMLSPIDKGTQSLHSTVELFNKYVPNISNDDCVDDQQYTILYDWSLNYKTVISFDAGVSKDLDNLNYFLEDPENYYPWSDYHENDNNLKGIRTAVSIILSEKIYNTAAIFIKGNYYFNPDNYGLIVCENTSLAKIEDLKKLESYGRFNSFEIELIQLLMQYI